MLNSLWARAIARARVGFNPKVGRSMMLTPSSSPRVALRSGPRQYARHQAFRNTLRGRPSQRSYSGFFVLFWKRQAATSGSRTNDRKFHVSSIPASAGEIASELRRKFPTLTSNADSVMSLVFFL
ncbi:hypothetical protein EAH68_01325 [Corynebacterium hylobatis]|uniref:Uncharacterized protein n=1 Tax=Corynebacterium hylobatis TaxID=1859290 RepID=A0A430I1F6_9CORY|nr:hypothetical protein EAH68_01325 [Corynebacterium hylobatis]